MTLAGDTQLRGMVFWLMGDLEDSRFLPVAAVIAGAILLWSIWNAPRLNLLARGESFAQLLGVPVVRLRVATLCAASLATAAAVTLAGTIGFVGLVVPHGLRLLVGNDQRVLSTTGGNLVVAVGFALMLAGLYTLRAPRRDSCNSISASRPITSASGNSSSSR